MRFPAALVVFLFHLSLPQIGLLPLGAEYTANVQWLVGLAGGLGVTFFFILSGFVIAWSAQRNDRAVSFWRRRFVKILPMYWISGLLAVAVSPDRIGLLPGYLATGEAWSHELGVYFGLNAPGWSLSVEAFFYAVFPFLIAPVLFWARNRRRLVLLVAGSFASVVAVVIVASSFNAGTSMPLDPGVGSTEYWLSYVFPVLRLPEFLLGGCAAIAIRNGWIPRLRIWPALAALGSGYAVSLFAPTLWSHRALLILPCLWIVTALATTNSAGVGTRPPRWALYLGELSFGFYLFHYPLLELTTRLLTGTTIHGDFAGFIIGGTVAFAATVGLAAALYASVELPLVNRFGRRVGPRATTGTDEPMPIPRVDSGDDPRPHAPVTER